jgi:hypothetical protein
VSAVTNGEIVPSRFDYGCVEGPAAKFLRGQAERIRRSVRNAIVLIGKDLILAKHYLSHGEFLRWVEDEIGIPSRTAQAYMRAAQWAEGKGRTVAHLPPTLLYILSAPSTPKDLIDAILERVEAGEQIEIPTVREELRKLRNFKDFKQFDRQTSADEAGRCAPDPAAGSDDLPDIIEAIKIIRLRLSDSDLARVRMIFTDQRVLHDPALSQKIATAFGHILEDSSFALRSVKSSNYPA